MITPQHQQRMQTGRAAQRNQRRRFQADRVDKYEAWIAGGMKGTPPEIPTDADYEARRNLRGDRR